MDERVFLFKKNQPVPSWDLLHRLPIRAPVGPECKDTATIFRINSSFMDITDQPYMYRQMQAGGVLVTFFAACAFIWVAFFLISLERDYMTVGLFAAWILTILAISAFVYLSIKFGRDEFFSLKRRPIRFNRKEQKIYAIRRRRFFAKAGEGDVTWEVPWNEQAIFCIHKNDNAADNAYHIRHYAVDANGNVLRAFALGRQWEGTENVQGLLSQWNYWCEYMNQGPGNLPHPPLFFSEHEDARESFLFCLYGMGFQASSLFRIFILPFVVLYTTHRLMSLWTCRDPVWPDWVEAVSQVAPDDPFNEPRGNTPVGWADTGMARERDEWPFDPKRDTTNWHGEMDPAKNAELWTADTPPITLLPSGEAA